MARYKDTNWSFPEGRVENWQQASVAVLMDIRDELKELNRTMSCFRVLRMANDIHRIDKRLAKNAPLIARKRSGE